MKNTEIWNQLLVDYIQDVRKAMAFQVAHQLSAQAKDNLETWSSAHWSTLFSRARQWQHQVRARLALMR